MPEISRFFGIIIRMYYKDHSPPHFHAVYGEHEAKINIDTFEINEGKLPNRALGLVLEWAALNRNELISNWEKSQKPEKLNKIKPLK